uniref:Uncharacterized protein n=1 Tax=Graphocephala atropunctata TaxID=36148 RepID=A0A1B6LI87_9HEMI
MMEPSLDIIKRDLRKLRQKISRSERAVGQNNTSGPQVQGSKKLGEGAVEEVLPTSSCVIPTNLETASGTTDTGLGTSSSEHEQRVLKEELPEVKQEEELILFEDECMDGSSDLQNDEGLNWETTAEEVGEMPNVPVKTEDVVDAPFETVFCEESSAKVKIEVEDYDICDPITSNASQPENCFEFVESREEPGTSFKTTCDKPLVDYMNIGIDNGEHPAVAQPKKKPRCITESSTSSELVVNLIGNSVNARKVYGGSRIVIGSKRKTSGNVFKICKFCTTNEMFISHKELMNHYRLTHNVSAIPSSPKAAGKSKATFKTNVTSAQEQDIPQEDICSSEISQKQNNDGQHVFHVISLQKVPKRRRKDAKDKITELLDFIVEQNVEPKLIDFFIKKHSKCN